MIRQIHPSLRWFAVVAALLLVALPVQADEIEPEPYIDEEVEPEPEPVVEEEAEPEPKAEAGYQARTATPAVGNEPSVGSMIFDCVLLRPLGLAATALGAVIFVPVGILASPSGVENIEAAWEIFVVAQVKYTFTRPLGEF